MTMQAKTEELDRTLLADLGFARGKGWPHEVWIYEGMFWVNYGDYDKKRWLNLDAAIDCHISRKKFLAVFIEKVKSEVRESYIEYTEDW